MQTDLDQAGPARMPSGAVLLGTEPADTAPTPPATAGRRHDALAAAVDRALAAAELQTIDDAAAELARRLARDLDAMQPGSRYASTTGRALGQVLDQLQLTPAARAAVDTAAQADNPLGEIRGQGPRPLRVVEDGAP